ncbi:MAG: hypothetical protein M1832_001433 [Thelocarpon impressellum]|nr:MAG: hypothetical protein M1832_001433 [Thelocarpon impressellum]
MGGARRRVATHRRRRGLRKRGEKRQQKRVVGRTGMGEGVTVEVTAMVTAEVTVMAMVVVRVVVMVVVVMVVVMVVGMVVVMVVGMVVVMVVAMVVVMVVAMVVVTVAVTEEKHKPEPPPDALDPTRLLSSRPRSDPRRGRQAIEPPDSRAASCRGERER